MSVQVYNGISGDTVYMEWMRKAVGDFKHKTLLDIMCGTRRMTKDWDFREKTFVDVKEQGEGIINQDVMTFFMLPPRRFYDVIHCSDGIEHVDKEKGWDIIRMCMCRASTSVFFTPLTALDVQPDSKDPYRHKCVWTPDDLPDCFKKVVFPDWHPGIGENGKPLGAWMFLYNNHRSNEVQYEF